MTLLQTVMLSYMHTPYLYGGSTILEGLDCSGYVIDLLKNFGIAPQTDMTAQQLYYYYKKLGGDGIKTEGSLVFYGESPDSLKHVMLYFGNDLVIGATGGDHTTITLPEAVKKNAKVSLRPIKYRKDYMAVVYPPLPRSIF